MSKTLSKAQLVEASKEYFNNYPEVPYFIATTDGNFFKAGKENAAANHATSAKVSSYRIERKELEEVQETEEVEEVEETEEVEEVEEVQETEETEETEEVEISEAALAQYKALEYKERAELINTLPTVDMVNAYIADESSKTVLEAALARIEFLQAQD